MLVIFGINKNEQDNKAQTSTNSSPIGLVYTTVQEQKHGLYIAVTSIVVCCGIWHIHLLKMSALHGAKD